MIKPGLCCISLALQERDPPVKFQTLTFKRFNSLSRDEALEILGDRILNNMIATNDIIKYCANKNWCYRLSSDLMPLISYDKANVDLSDLPNYSLIQDAFDQINYTIQRTKIRISAHPDQFNVLASTNEQSVSKTIKELNLMSGLMDRFGLSADYCTPINIHINNRQGSNEDIVARFMTNFSRLDENCRKRLVVENDDKINCWSVRQLIDDFHSKTNIPITFDYLHHACHSDFMTEREAIEECYMTWQNYQPLFHYSESAPGNNPRKHADYATQSINTYGLEFDLDFEIKQKDLAIAHYQELYPTFGCYQQPTMAAN
jgi:UV DNA damage endonuclease